MGRRVTILAAAMLAPLVARAEPAQLQLGPAAPRTAHTDYAATAPAALGGASHGWGLHASMGGQSMDLDRPSLGWADDAVLGPHESDAGYGWRGGAASATLGYAEFDRGARLDPRAPDYTAQGPKEATSSVLGLSFVLRTR